MLDIDEGGVADGSVRRRFGGATPAVIHRGRRHGSSPTAARAPYYEQARPVFANQQDRLMGDAANTVFTYLPDTLQCIAERTDREG